jgi:hypothetical protein
LWVALRQLLACPSLATLVVFLAFLWSEIDNTTAVLVVQARGAAIGCVPDLLSLAFTALDIILGTPAAWCQRVEVKRRPVFPTFWAAHGNRGFGPTRLLEVGIDEKVMSGILDGNSAFTGSVEFAHVLVFARAGVTIPNQEVRRRRGAFSRELAPLVRFSEAFASQFAVEVGRANDGNFSKALHDSWEFNLCSP